MNSKIISLNVGTPSEMHWGDKSVISSMLRKPISGPLIVHHDHIEGDGFKNDRIHGTSDSVIYLIGSDALAQYAKMLGKDVLPGEVGENVTLESLDETAVAIGDEFKIGEVVFQATFPRIPCSKVNFRFQHPEGQQMMKDLGRSGVYGKIIKPGKIHIADRLEKIKSSGSKINIAMIYKIWIEKKFPNLELYEALKTNSAFPKEALELLNPNQA